MKMDFEDCLGGTPQPRFVIFSSYGNDSVAMIQWAHEQGLKDVVVVYSNTGWAASWWQDRVYEMENWVRGLGFYTSRTTSLGFRELAIKKKAFPTQRYQWCSYILKIEPAERWLQVNDPDCRATCLVGVRRSESQDRAEFPRYLLASPSHGGRIMIAPMADWKEDTRDIFIRRAGVEPLPHRSMECSPCINSNKKDLVALREGDVMKAADLENELNETFGPTRNGKPRTFFRPGRHMGAVGVHEVIKWAHSKRGEYSMSENEETMGEYDQGDDIDDEGAAGCEAGWCG